MTMLRKELSTYHLVLRQSIITRAILFFFKVTSREKSHRGLGERKHLIAKVLWLLKVESLYPLSSYCMQVRDAEGTTIFSKTANIPDDELVIRIRNCRQDNRATVPTTAESGTVIQRVFLYYVFTIHNPTQYGNCQVSQMSAITPKRFLWFLACALFANLLMWL